MMISPILNLVKPSLLLSVLRSIEKDQVQLNTPPNAEEQSSDNETHLR